MADDHSPRPNAETACFKCPFATEKPTREEAEFLRDAILPVGRTGGREIPRELLHQRVGVALHLAPDIRIEGARRAERFGIGAGDAVLRIGDSIERDLEVVE